MITLLHLGISIVRNKNTNMAISTLIIPINNYFINQITPYLLLDKIQLQQYLSLPFLFFGWNLMLKYLSQNFYPFY